MSATPLFLTCSFSVIKVLSKIYNLLTSQLDNISSQLDFLIIGEPRPPP
jgi:hypothetical protein